MYAVTISTQWRPRGLNQPVYRERLTIELNNPLEELMSPAVLGKQPGLRNFVFDGAHGLVRDWRGSGGWWDIRVARSDACEAARFLMFMDATALRRSKVFGGDTGSNWDHTHFWYLPRIDPRQYAYTVEPYHDDGMPGLDLPAIRSSWGGMWNPPSTSLWLISPSRKPAVPLDALAEALDRLPPPPIASAWPGEDTTQFTRRPLFKETQRAERSRDHPPPTGSAR